MDHTQDAIVFDQPKWRAAGARDLVDRGAEGLRLRHVLTCLITRELEDGIHRALAQLALADVDTRESRGRRELDEFCFGGCTLTGHVIFFLRHGDYGTAFRRLVG